MSDLETLENALLADIAAAADEQAIEAVRVAALGKKGSVSEMLKTLGAMSAGGAPDQGPGDQRPEEPRHRSARRPQGRTARMRRSPRGLPPKRSM